MVLPPVRVDLLTVGNQALPGAAGIPRIFVSSIQSSWLINPEHIIIGATLREPNSTSWISLGDYALEQLLAGCSCLGLAFDGQCGVMRAVRWLTEAHKCGDPGLIDVCVESSRNPRTGAPLSENVTWSSLHPLASSSWMRTLWHETGSELFNFGCDLLVAFYGSNVLASYKREEPFTLSIFGRTLAQADAWMIPLDENLGYIMGLTRESGFYRALASS